MSACVFVGVCVQRTVQKGGRISCYCPRKTVLKYRNVSYEILFCLTHLKEFVCECSGMPKCVSVQQVCVHGHGLDSE